MCRLPDPDMTAYRPARTHNNFPMTPRTPSVRFHFVYTHQCPPARATKSRRHDTKRRHERILGHHPECDNAEKPHCPAPRPSRRRERQTVFAQLRMG